MINKAEDIANISTREVVSIRNIFEISLRDSNIDIISVQVRQK